MHVEADLLNNVYNIWASEGELLKGSSYTPVIGGVGDRDAISRKLRVSIHGVLQDLQSRIPAWSRISIIYCR
jgi:hypothetical protein